MARVDPFTAIADTTRRDILAILQTGPHSVGAIASRFSISDPAISQHLKALRAARLVQVRIDAQRRIYELDPHGFQVVDCWLARYQRFWNTKLDALEAALSAASLDSTARRGQYRARSPKRRKANRS